MTEATYHDADGVPVAEDDPDGITEFADDEGDLTLYSLAIPTNAPD